MGLSSQQITPGIPPNRAKKSSAARSPRVVAAVIIASILSFLISFPPEITLHVAF